MENGKVRNAKVIVLTVLIALIFGSVPAMAEEGRQVFFGPGEVNPSRQVNSSRKSNRRRGIVRKADHAVVRSQDYLIGPEDVLEISVWKNPALSKTVKVRPDGKISMPLIGDIKASGLTPNQLRKVIERDLSRYQQTAIASVIVTEVNSYRIFILGEVKSPGAYQMKTRTSVLQAIALAGGFTEFAARNKMKLIRRKKDGSGDEKMTIRFKDLVYKKDSGKDIILKPGDTIFVP